MQYTIVSYNADKKSTHVTHIGAFTARDAARIFYHQQVSYMRGEEGGIDPAWELIACIAGCQLPLLSSEDWQDIVDEIEEEQHEQK